MLQLEEEKALKKIEETRKKAKQMLDVKINNEQRNTKHLNKLIRSLTPPAVGFRVDD